MSRIGPNVFKRIQYATKIKVRAERRCEELLAASVEHGGDRKTESRSKPPTLIEMGLTKDESNRYQSLASMSTGLTR